MPAIAAFVALWSAIVTERGRAAATGEHDKATGEYDKAVRLHCQPGFERVNSDRLTIRTQPEGREARGDDASHKQQTGASSVRGTRPPLVCARRYTP